MVEIFSNGFKIIAIAGSCGGRLVGGVFNELSDH